MADERELLLYRLHLKFKFWLAFQVLIPITCVVLIWPIHRLFERPFGFERTFAEAELLLLGALLLFGAMIDIYYEQKANSRLAGCEILDTLYIVNGTAGFLVLILYAALKIYMVLYEFPRTAVVPPAPEVGFCAYTSLVGVVAAAAWSGFTIHRSYTELAAPSLPAPEGVA